MFVKMVVNEKEQEGCVVSLPMSDVVKYVNTEMSDMVGEMIPGTADVMIVNGGHVGDSRLEFRWKIRK